MLPLVGLVHAKKESRNRSPFYRKFAPKKARQSQMQTKDHDDPTTMSVLEATLIPQDQLKISNTGVTVTQSLKWRLRRTDLKCMPEAPFPSTQSGRPAANIIPLQKL